MGCCGSALELRNGLGCCKAFSLNVAPFPPLPINAAFWNGGFWHAPDINQAAGSDVLAWVPRTGATTLTGTAGTTAPKYQTNYLGSDGKPSVEFTAALSQRLVGDALASLANSPVFAFIDCSPFSTTLGCPVCFARAADASMRRELRQDTLFNALYDDGTGGAAAVINSYTTDGLPILNARQMAYGLFDTATVQVGLDKTSPAASATTSIFNFDRFTLGGRRAGGGVTNPFGGRIRTFGLSSTLPNLAQLTEIYNWCYRVPKTIWMLGDSITLGTGSSSSNGWRLNFWQNVALNNARAELVGIITSGAGWVHRNHGGVSGNTIAQISARVTSDIAGIAPDIVSLMAGTNNMATYVPSTTIAEYIALLDNIHTLRPSARILTTRLIPRSDPTLQANTVLFNAEYATAIASWSASHPGVIISGWDAWTAIGGAYNAANYADAIHPNDTGYNLILNTVGTGLWQALQPVIA